MKNNASSTTAPAPKSPDFDFFMKDASLIPSMDLHPVDLKRWLDFVPAQHGNRQNRWEAIDTLRKQLQGQMMSRHAVDYMSLLYEYGVISADVKVDILDHAGRKEEDGDDDLDGDEVKPDGSNCLLTVYPITGATFDYWVITGGGPEIFHSMQDTTVAYLYIPFGREGREAAFSMQDRIIWIDGNMVLAMAEIDAFHQQEIVVVNDGLIVPVSASFWPRVLPPINLEKSCPIYGEKDTQAEYDQILFSKPRCPQQSTQTTLWQKALDDRPLPQLANELGISLGNHVFKEVEEVMKMEPDAW